MLTFPDIYQNAVVSEQEALDRMVHYSENNVQVESDQNILWHYNQIFGLYHFFIKKDIDKAKNCFYNCGRIDEYLIKKYDSRLLDTGMANISYALLSDNLCLITRYTDLSHSKFQRMIEHGYSTLIYAVQQSIKEDTERVQWSLDIMANKNQKLNKVLMPDRIFLEKLIEKNKHGMEEAIRLLLKDHKKRNKYMGIAQDYISIPALGYAKLAWLQGIEIEIDHPLVPKELLTVKPLERYEDKYGFLKELDYPIN